MKGCLQTYRAGSCLIYHLPYYNMLMLVAHLMLHEFSKLASNSTVVLQNTGITPLMIACLSGRTEVVTALLSSGASVTAREVRDIIWTITVDPFDCLIPMTPNPSKLVRDGSQSSLWLGLEKACFWHVICCTVQTNRGSLGLMKKVRSSKVKFLGKVLRTCLQVG